jgi:hypothetical protein
MFESGIESFRQLLEKNGIESAVVRRHIGLTQYDDEFWSRALAYLIAHSELRDP